nr:putative ribonuclease H-like domain-containing protein [Tanacetum cinerariifolium]
MFVRDKMSRDVITVGSTMRISLLYRGEYSQWHEGFMNYLEEQTDDEAMVNSIQNGDHPLPVVTQVSLAETTILLKIYGMLLKGRCVVLRYNKKAVVVTSDPLALVAEKTKVSKRKEKVILQSESEGSDDEDITSSSANKKPKYVKSDVKKVDKKSDEKKWDMSKQTSSLKPYVPTAILEKIIIDLEDKVVSLLEKEKENLEIIESLKSKGFESSENAISESENQSENDCQEVAKDVVIGSMTIKKVYYVKGLRHNFFSVRQFCDKGLEVAFRKSTCFVQNEDGVDFLIDDRSSNLYTIALNEIASNSSACLLAKASSSQSWLWHQRLSHLNFAIINNLAKRNLVRGLPKMKFEKVHLCSACEQGKIHQKHHMSKTTFALNKPLYLLHMDLCGPIHVESINEKRYVLVVVDDYSLYTWVFFLHSKDEAFKVIISFIKKTQVNLQLQVQHVRTDNETEFKNKTLAKFFDEITKYPTTNVETSNSEIPSHEGKVFHDVSESFQDESSLSSLNDDVQ